MRGGTFLAVLVIVIGLGLMIAGTNGQMREVLQVLKK